MPFASSLPEREGRLADHREVDQDNPRLKIAGDLCQVDRPRCARGGEGDEPNRAKPQPFGVEVTRGVCAPIPPGDDANAHDGGGAGDFANRPNG